VTRVLETEEGVRRLNEFIIAQLRHFVQDEATVQDVEFPDLPFTLSIDLVRQEVHCTLKGPHEQLPTPDDSEVISIGLRLAGHMAASDKNTIHAHHKHPFVIVIVHYAVPSLLRI
jgi:hypothetical protein